MFMTSEYLYRNAGNERKTHWSNLEKLVFIMQRNYTVKLTKQLFISKMTSNV